MIHLVTSAESSIWNLETRRWFCSFRKCMNWSFYTRLTIRTPHICCTYCAGNLRHWLMALCRLCCSNDMAGAKDHVSDCYFRWQMFWAIPPKATNHLITSVLGGYHVMTQTTTTSWWQSSYDHQENGQRLLWPSSTLMKLQQRSQKTVGYWSWFPRTALLGCHLINRPEKIIWSDI